MTPDQARRLKRAVTDQHHARERLMWAANTPDDETTRKADVEIVQAAQAYIDATDACYLIATEISPAAAQAGKETKP